MTRLDQYLVESGQFESRARAQAAVKAGLVRINTIVCEKPAQKLPAGANIEVNGDVHPYVSRGGVKLDAILRAMEINASGAIALDLGASTGGFTEVLLAAGALKVYAVDVGQRQLHDKLRNDDRVINLEKTHAKDLTRALVPDPIEIIVCDVSFISLKKALPPALALATPGARLAALIKPQFEVGRARLGKGGIVKPGYENSVGVAEDIHAWINTLKGWASTGFIESPIEGGDGNKEYLIGATHSA